MRQFQCVPTRYKTDRNAYAPYQELIYTSSNRACFCDVAASWSSSGQKPMSRHCNNSKFVKYFTSNLGLLLPYTLYLMCWHQHNSKLQLGHCKTVKIRHYVLKITFCQTIWHIQFIRLRVYRWRSFSLYGRHPTPIQSHYNTCGIKVYFQLIRSFVIIAVSLLLLRKIQSTNALITPPSSISPMFTQTAVSTWRVNDESAAKIYQVIKDISNWPPEFTLLQPTATIPYTSLYKELSYTNYTVNCYYISKLTLMNTEAKINRQCSCLENVAADRPVLGNWTTVIISSG